MKDSYKLLFLVVLLVFLFWAAFRLRGFGEPVEAGMDEYFLANAQQETGSNNAVASIVFDYRGLDTLGEATVLFTAAIGIVLLFRSEGK